jgi:hypothetical protein
MSANVNTEGHIHEYAPDLLGMLTCLACGDAIVRPFMPDPHDFARWRGHLKSMFGLLRDGGWHMRDELVRVGTKNFTARISNLRERGCVIECDRLDEQGATRYRMTGVLDHSTTTPPDYHCAGCACAEKAV